MDRTLLAQRYFDAWCQKDLAALLSLLHPQASYYNAFWQETCTGPDLAKYLRASLDLDTRTYRIDGDVLPTPNGMILRYVAYERNANGGSTPVYNGAEILTVRNDRIRTISDYYCDPNPAELADLASLAEQQHERAQRATQGLSAKMIRRIGKRLVELSDTTTTYLDPGLTVTRLAEAVGCSAKQLFYVLEVEQQTTFMRHVNECRARHASTLMTDQANDSVNLENVALQAGFDSVENFRDVFASTFGISASQYVKQFRS